MEVDLQAKGTDLHDATVVGDTVGRAQNIESTENIRVFGGFLRAKGVFWKKMTAIEAFSRFLGKRFFVETV